MDFVWLSEWTWTVSRNTWKFIMNTDCILRWWWCWWQELTGKFHWNCWTVMMMMMMMMMILGTFRQGSFKLWDDDDDDNDDRRNIPAKFIETLQWKCFEDPWSVNTTCYMRTGRQTNLIFRGPCIVTYSGDRASWHIQVTVHRDIFLKIKPTRCTNFSNLFLE